MAGSPEWKAWTNLGRSKAVCERWRGSDGFSHFLADVGRRPSDDHQLFRLNLERPLEPGNASWLIRGVDVIPQKGRGQYRHGKNRTPTWTTWMAMRRRCDDPSNNRYRHYGARGIVVCDRWIDSFENFLSDMGEKPPGTSIDRIDVNGNYEPGNCRWASTKVQARNTTCTKLEAHEPAQILWLLAEGYTQTEIARFFDVSQSTISLISLGKTWKEEANV